MLRPLINTFLVMVAAVGAILGLYWHDGYKKLKARDENLSFKNYIVSDLKNTKLALSELPEILNEARKSQDQLRIGSINKIKDALEMYNLNNNYYPENIQSLKGNYIDRKTKIFDDPSFFYISDKNQFELGIKLENGEVYKVSSNNTLEQ